MYYFLHPIKTWECHQNTIPCYRYWAISERWAVLAAPFAARLMGHQQITDSYLLGLAVKQDGVLVTFDKGIKYLAGTGYSRNVLALDSPRPVRR